MQYIIKNNVNHLIEMSEIYIFVDAQNTQIFKKKLKQIVEPKMCRFSYSPNIQKSMSTEYNDFTFYIIWGSAVTAHTGNVSHHLNYNILWYQFKIK